MESKIKHLEFVQTIIGRMAQNSFLLKGWLMTLALATISLTKLSLSKVLLISLRELSSPLRANPVIFSALFRIDFALASVVLMKP
jgi:hypothetical protein